MEQAKIRAIRRYLSKNGVKYYDVQAELIDHFATAVERIEREEPDIRFKVALLKAHRSFGGSRGFEKYLKQAEKDVSRKTWKLIGLVLIQFLKWPYIAITAGLFVAWYYILTYQLIKLDWLMGSLLLSFLGLMLVNYLRLRKIEMFLPREANRALGWIFYALFWIPGQPLMWRGGEPINLLYPLVYFSLFTLVFIAFYRVPKMAVQETRQIYPQMAP